MANKGFGIRELTLIEGAGTPKLSVPQNLDIDAVVVGISTGLVVGGAVTIAGPLGVGTITSTGRITATEINAEYYFTESADNNSNYNIPFMGDAQGGNSYSALQVDNSVLQFNPGTNILKTNNLEAFGYIDAGNGYIGDGSQLTGIVTSVVAGSDVTVSQTGGTVTINSTSGVGSDASVNTTGIITAASFDTNGIGAATIRVAVGNTLNIEAPIVAVSTDMTVGGLATISNLSVPTLADLPVIGPGLGQTTRLSANQVAISTNCSVGNDLTIGGNIGLTGNINSNGGTLNVNSNDFRVFNSAGTVKKLDITNNSGIIAEVDFDVNGQLTANSYRTGTTVGDGSDKSYGIVYSISANSGNYRFAGPGLTNTTDNPTLRLHRGQTYVFENTTGSSHPFQIRYTAGGTGYGSTYLSGSTSGTQTFVVPYDAPTHLVYQCTQHPGMLGDIYVDYAPEYIPFGFIKEGVNITSGKLSDNTDIDLDNNLFSFFTVQETTTSTPNLRWNSQTTLDSKMEVGESISVSIMNTASAAGFSTALSIDGSAATIKWFNGVVPAQGGTGNDVYNYTVIKTGSSAFTVLANLSSYI